MNNHIDGSRPMMKRFLGKREDLIHLVANWVDESTAKKLRKVFEGTLPPDKFWATISPRSVDFIKHLASIHEIQILAAPEQL